MNYDENIYAEVVFDGNETHAPTRMGTPKGDQLQGTTLEKLSELAGRVCYDSLGKGRSSEAYHTHIAEVGHGSVWEHANFTVELSCDKRSFLGDVAAQCLNHPGVHVDFPGGSRPKVRITLNIRAAVAWEAVDTFDGAFPYEVNAAVLSVAHELAPQIVTVNALDDLAAAYGCADLSSSMLNHSEGFQFAYVPPQESEEKWVSLLLGGSRGMSHEQVRHKFRTAISQRSTRYVDESESAWVEHPLVTEYSAEMGKAEGLIGIITVPRDAPLDEAWKQDSGSSDLVVPLRDLAASTYAVCTEQLQAWMEMSAVDKHTARKQARGAARGYLGNALATEMIFSASVAQWRRMIEQRCTIHADAEIRVLYGKVLQALRTTLWAKDFEDFNLIPSPDGIGEVIE